MSCLMQMTLVNNQQLVVCIVYKLCKTIGVKKEGYWYSIFSLNMTI